MPETRSDNPAYAFLDRQLALVGDRDPLAVMASTPRLLGEAVAGHDDQALARAPRPGAWSPVAQLAHVADMEWVFGFRSRTIFADQPAPTLVGIDQDRWVRAQRPEGQPASVWIDRFELARRVNLAFWRGLADDELERFGIHADARVELSLGLLRRIIAGHDLLHLDRLRHDLKGVS